MDRITASFRALCSSGYFTRRAARRSTLAARRNPPISFAQNFHHSRNFRNPKQRPAPPNLPRQRDGSVRPAVAAPVAQKKLHFAHQFVARQSQQCSHAWILQRRQRHPAPLQNRRNPPCDSRTEAAFRVPEQPPARVPPLPVRVLTHQRNHGLFSSLLPHFLTARLSTLLCDSQRPASAPTRSGRLRVVLFFFSFRNFQP